MRFLATALLVGTLFGAQPPNRVIVSPQEQEHKLIRRIEPKYPAQALRARITGIVKLEIILNKDGTLQWAKLISGHPLLTAAAMDAVKRWVYRPTEVNGEPVEVLTEVEVEFQLPQRTPQNRASTEPERQPSYGSRRELVHDA